MERLNYDTIKSYQSFKSMEEMDEAVRGFLYIHKAALSNGTIDVLKFIWRYSVKVIGVSFAKYDTIASETGLSRRTVIRSIQTLEKLEIIKKIPTSRMNGKQGVNLIIIQPYEPITELKNKMSPQDVTAPVTPNKTEKKQRSLCENQLKPFNVREAENLSHHEKAMEQPTLDTSYLPSSIDQDFIEAAKPFFHAMDIYELWKRVVIAYQKSSLEKPLYMLINLVISAFKQAIFMNKAGRIHTTFEGYFYQIIFETFRAERRKQHKPKGFDLFVEILEGKK